MKQDEYTKAVLEKMDENDEITCEDCGLKDKIAHAIVDHGSDKIMVVCNDCFNAKYRDGLYPNRSQ